MIRTFLFFILINLPLSSKGEETAIETARRVIKDNSTVRLNIVAFPYRDPDENRLVDAADKSEYVIKQYILNENTPESVLLSYAIRVLRKKRIPWETNPNMLGIDTRMNDGYLNDGLKLAERLNEITKAERNTGQSAIRPESDPNRATSPKTP